jgi:uncharacterized protein YmfQ (DUF2313 family)
MAYSPQSRHYSVLKKLFPLNLEGDLDVLLDAEGLALDRAEDTASRLHQELFPDTATSDPVFGTLADWERTFGITPPDGATDQQRGAVVVAHMRVSGCPMTKDGKFGNRLNKTYFYSIASALGYSTNQADPKWIKIEDGKYRPFRVGFGKVGDAVYFNDHGYSMYSIHVTGTGVEQDAELQKIFTDGGRPGADWVFINA